MIARLASKEKTHALIAGIGKRPEDHDALKITVTDAQLFATELIARTPLAAANCKVIVDQETQLQLFISQLDQLAAKTALEPAELVIIYFSGHGCLVAGNYYLICNDSLNSDIANTSLAGTLFVQKLMSVKTDKMLVLLDCCHANGITQPQAVPFNAVPLLEAANRVVITASHASQSSYVSRPVSIFTFALIEALAGKYFKDGDKDVNIFDLAMYIRERVYPLSGHRQQPQLHILENAQTSNFILARYPAGHPRPPAFSETFSLLDENGKSIDLDVSTERDAAYRAQFNWFNNVEIRGDGNVGIVDGQGNIVTINNNSSGPELITALEVVAKQQRQMDDLIQLLREQLRPEFHALADKIERFTLLDTVLVQKKSLLFIGRREFKEPLLKMLNGEVKDVMVVKGEAKSGLTYITHFISDIGARHNCFEFHYIDVQMISRTYPGELITAAHIAEIFAAKIGLTISTHEFKLQTFVGAVRTELDKKADAGDKCLFYFDQFHVKLATDAQYLLEALARMVVVENAKTFMIFAGYKESEEWPKDIRRVSQQVKLNGFFERNHVTQFLDMMYESDEVNFKVVNKPTFVASAMQFLPDDLFVKNDKPNVEAVGDALADWYDRIRDTI